MDAKTLSSELRSRRGKGGAREARRQGKIPAICYARGKESIALNVSPHDLQKAVATPWGMNTVLSLEVKDNGSSSTRTVLLHDFQTHPVSKAFLHADFREVDPAKPTRVEVAISVTGHAIGQIEGGILHQVVRRVPVVCLPADIPAKIEVDISALAIGDGIKAENLRPPANVKIVMDPKQTVVHVVAPEEEKVVEAAVAAPAEGEVAVAGVPGAAPGVAPAAGAAPAAAGVGAAKPAAKPAAGGKEKK